MKRVFFFIVGLVAFITMNGQIAGNYVAQNGFSVQVEEYDDGITVSGGGETISYSYFSENKYMNANRVSCVVFNDTKMMLLVDGKTDIFYKTKRRITQNNNYQNQSNYNNSTTTPSQKKCSVCNGTGKSSSVVWAPEYTSESSTKWCDICNSRGRSHTHKLCYTCGGLGYK